MSADPADIAKYTNDGVVVTRSNQSIVDLYPDALDGRQDEIEMFFASAAHSDILLSERFALLSQTEPVHELVEIDDRLGLGVDIPISPAVPTFLVVDQQRDISTICRLRGFSVELESDREAVEVIE